MKDRKGNELAIGDSVCVGQITYIDEGAKVAIVKFPDDIHLSGWNLLPGSIELISSADTIDDEAIKARQRRAEAIAKIVSTLSHAGAIVTCSIDVKA